MAVEAQHVAPETDRLPRLIEEQERIFCARQPRSRELSERAARSLAGGVTSSWQISRPQVVWIDHGVGSKVFDADGNEYVDMHGGYGVSAVGHAHPKIVEAASRRVRLGTHFAQPVEDAIAVAEDLAGRIGLPLWRFGNSGTEATMDAVHLMRAVTGRPKIVKVEGTYHGHHDSVQVSVYEDLENLGPELSPFSVPSESGIPEDITRLTRVVPFNNLDALEGVFAEEDGAIAGMIVEPVMMNIGIVPPLPGYLEGIQEITRRHGALLAFDEVKTGLTVGPGGATKLFGVTPDIVCLAKAIGGGLACAAVGGTEDVMSHIAQNSYQQVGTFNGNPMAMAAARTTLTEILTDDAYGHFDRLRAILVDGCERVIAEYGLRAHMVALGAKGCVVFSTDPIRNYREFLRIDDRFSHLHWLMQHNGGVFLPPWGKAEQWMLSVQHSEDDVRRFVSNFEAFAAVLGS
jgi:glutamate-1-semialdehyde 2,1-aminomutase